MALFDECMPLCCSKVLDIADIVRDGDFATAIAQNLVTTLDGLVRQNGDGGHTAEPVLHRTGLAAFNFPQERVCQSLSC